VPGVIKADTISHGGVAFRHGGLVALGITNMIAVPFVAATFGYALAPKLMVFARSFNPVPVIITTAPTGPASGWSDVIVGPEDGETLLSAVHATRATAARHVQTTLIVARGGSSRFRPRRGTSKY
jgi:hypothetical protein